MAFGSLVLVSTVAHSSMQTDPLQLPTKPSRYGLLSMESSVKHSLAILKAYPTWPGLQTLNTSALAVMIKPSVSGALRKEKQSRYSKATQTTFFV